MLLALRLLSLLVFLAGSFGGGTVVVRGGVVRGGRG